MAYTTTWNISTGFFGKCPKEREIYVKLIFFEQEVNEKPLVFYKISP